MSSVPAPMVGAWQVEIRAVQPFEIHGDRYFELHVVRVGDPERHILAVRVPEHAFKSPPAPGQAVNLTFLMGQVTAVDVTS